MSVCATCLQPDIRDGKHDCPGLGDIQATRKLGHGLIVDAAPARARMALSVLVDAKWGARLERNGLVNIGDQVLYRVTGYDAETASLLLELVEDWRKPGVITFDRRISDAEYEAFKARWRETYGKPGAAHPWVVLADEEGPDA